MHFSRQTFIPCTRLLLIKSRCSLCSNKEFQSIIFQSNNSFSCNPILISIHHFVFSLTTFCTILVYIQSFIMSLITLCEFATPATSLSPSFNFLDTKIVIVSIFPFACNILFWHLLVYFISILCPTLRLTTSPKLHVFSVCRINFTTIFVFLFITHFPIVYCSELIFLSTLYAIYIIIHPTMLQYGCYYCYFHARPFFLPRALDKWWISLSLMLLAG